MRSTGPNTVYWTTAAFTPAAVALNRKDPVVLPTGSQRTANTLASLKMVPRLAGDK